MLTVITRGHACLPYLMSPDVQPSCRQREWRSYI